MRKIVLIVIALVLASGVGAAPEQRLVAVGDLHGDLEAARQALRLAGAIDENNRWVGGSLILVQTGDILDRGDQERAILQLFARLENEAAAAGGAVYLLNGNHELMNARLDLRYVTEGGFADFQDLASDAPADSLLLAHDVQKRGRVAAFRPGGPFARMLAESPVVLVLENTLFVHGGILPWHLEYGLDRLNREVSQWLLGQGEAPDFIHTGKSPTWDRTYSDAVTDSSCLQLNLVLEKLKIQRMVVGHTVQDDGIRSYCEGRVWCIDSGISHHYGNQVQVLEIEGDRVRALR